MTEAERKRKSIQRSESELALEGKMIASVAKYGYAGYDDENLLVLKMTDGSVFSIYGGFGGYTGHSMEEYTTFIKVNQKKKGGKK